MADKTPGEGGDPTPGIRSDDPSLAIRLAAWVIKFTHKGPKASDPAKLAARYRDRSYPTHANPPAGMLEAFEVTTDETMGAPVLVIRPRLGASRWRIVYTHGGAYVNPLLKAHWGILRALAEATRATLYVPIYPLAPEHDSRPAYDLLRRLYDRLLSEGPADSLVLAGDSAGGGLAIGQALAYRDARLPLPARIVLLAPWLDLTLADPDMRAMEPWDVMLRIDRLRAMGSWWAGDDDPKGSRFSAVYADLEGLCPVDIYQGDRDIFVIDARTVSRRLQQADVEVAYREYPGAFHVFMALTGSREGRDVFRRIGANLAGDSRAP